MSSIVTPMRSGVSSKYEYAKTYLADLPATAQDGLRFFSAKPGNRDWNRHFPHHVLLEVAHPEHLLRNSALSNVTEVSLKCSRTPNPETVSRLFEVLGAHLSALSIVGYYEQGIELDVKCTNLKSLIIEPLSFLACSISSIPSSNLISARHNREVMNMNPRSECLIHVGAGLKRLDLQINLKLGSHFTRTFGVLGRTLDELSLRISQEEEDSNPERFNVGKLVALCPNIVNLLIFPVRVTH